MCENGKLIYSVLLLPSSSIIWFWFIKLVRFTIWLRPALVHFYCGYRPITTTTTTTNQLGTGLLKIELNYIPINQKTGQSIPGFFQTKYSIQTWTKGIHSFIHYHLKKKHIKMNIWKRKVGMGVRYPPFYIFSCFLVSNLQLI